MTQTNYLYSDLTIDGGVAQSNVGETGVAPLEGLSYLMAANGASGSAYYSKEKQYENMTYGVMEGWFYISTLGGVTVTRVGMLSNLDESYQGVAYGIYYELGTWYMFSGYYIGAIEANEETVDVTLEFGDITEQWFRLRVTTSLLGAIIEVYDSEGGLLSGHELTTLSHTEGTNGFYLDSDVLNFVLLDSTSIDNE